MAERIDWKRVITHGATIVESYSTGVTLRQLFYRLVSQGLIPNTIPAYKRLSHLTAIERRKQNFPDLIDNTRRIRGGYGSDDPDAFLESLIQGYRRNRTEGQKYTICVGVEKNALVTQISSWFGKKGLPVLAFGGYPSQTFVDDITEYVQSFDRPAIMIYAGDFDATGVDIIRDFKKRTPDLWEQVHQIALTKKQIADFDLPPLPGKDWDPRAARFMAQHGELVQVELDALDPNDLKKIYDDAVNQFWNKNAYDKAVKQEKKDRESMVTPSQAKAIKEERDGLKETADEAEKQLLEKEEELKKEKRRKEVLAQRLEVCGVQKKELYQRLDQEKAEHKKALDDIKKKHKTKVDGLVGQINDLKKAK